MSRRSAAHPASAPPKDALRPLPNLGRLSLARTVSDARPVGMNAPDEDDEDDEDNQYFLSLYDDDDDDEDDDAVDLDDPNVGEDEVLSRLFGSDAESDGDDEGGTVAAAEAAVAPPLPSQHQQQPQETSDAVDAILKQIGTPDWDHAYFTTAILAAMLGTTSRNVSSMNAVRDAAKAWCATAKDNCADKNGIFRLLISCFGTDVPVGASPAPFADWQQCFYALCNAFNEKQSSPMWLVLQDALKPAKVEGARFIHYDDGRPMIHSFARIARVSQRLVKEAILQNALNPRQVDHMMDLLMRAEPNTANKSKGAFTIVPDELASEGFVNRFREEVVNGPLNQRTNWAAMWKLMSLRGGRPFREPFVSSAIVDAALRRAVDEDRGGDQVAQARDLIVNKGADLGQDLTFRTPVMFGLLWNGVTGVPRTATLLLTALELGKFEMAELLVDSNVSGVISKTTERYALLEACMGAIQGVGLNDDVPERVMPLGLVRKLVQLVTRAQPYTFTELLTTWEAFEAAATKPISSDLERIATEARDALLTRALDYYNNVVIPDLRDVTRESPEWQYHPLQIREARQQYYADVMNGFLSFSDDNGYPIAASGRALMHGYEHARSTLTRQSWRDVASDTMEVIENNLPASDLTTQFRRGALIMMLQPYLN